MFRNKQNFRAGLLMQLEESMLGNDVTVFLTGPEEQIRGTLNKQDATGVWILFSDRLGYTRTADGGFYPMHRVLKIEDHGYRFR